MSDVSMVLAQIAGTSDAFDAGYRVGWLKLLIERYEAEHDFEHDPERDASCEMLVECRQLLAGLQSFFPEEWPEGRLELGPVDEQDLHRLADDGCPHHVELAPVSADSSRYSLPAKFRDLIGRSIDSRGVRPAHQAIHITREGHTVSSAIDGSSYNRMRWLESVVKAGAREIIWGSDDYPLPAQETEFGNLVAGAYFFEGFWRPFIFEYRHEPRIVRPMDWRNGDWNAAIARELAAALPEARILIPGDPGVLSRGVCA